MQNAEEMLEQIFYYMNKLIVEKDFNNAILLLTDLGRTLVNAERTSFWYWDVGKKQYWTLAATQTGKIVVPEGSGIVGASISNKETIVINNPYEDERFNPQIDKETGYLTKSILCMPVTNGHGDVIGAYQAINKINGKESCFDEQDVKRLALAAVYSGKTLEAHLLSMQSQIDQLTGIRNRRGFYEYYRNSNAKSLAICDIDFFKKVNDTYGHNAGDVVLMHVADLMRHFFEEHGEVFRWGGEEFIILFQEADRSKAVEFAEEARKLIEDSMCRFEGMEIKVTMSFGVTEIVSEKMPDENVKEADLKLYEAKTTGRNKVIS